MTIKDHLGNEFKTNAEMCKFYNISIHTFCARIAYGWTVERALTELFTKKEQINFALFFCINEIKHKKMLLKNKQII